MNISKRIKNIAVVLTLAVAGTMPSQVDAAQGLLGIFLQGGGNQVYVSGVIPGSSAQSVGIQPGWRLLSVDYRNIFSVSDALYAKSVAPDFVPVRFVFGLPGGGVVALNG